SLAGRALVGWWKRQHVRLLTGKIRVRIPALQPTRRQRDAAAACPPFNRDEVGSIPTAGTNPGFVQRQDLRPITGKSRFESSSLDQVDEVLLAARLPRKQEARVRRPASAPFSTSELVWS